MLISRLNVVLKRVFLIAGIWPPARSCRARPRGVSIGQWPRRSLERHPPHEFEVLAGPEGDRW